MKNLKFILGAFIAIALLSASALGAEAHDAFTVIATVPVFALPNFLEEKSITVEAFGEMEVSEQVKLYNEFHATGYKRLSDLIEEKATPDAIKAAREEILASVQEANTKTSELLSIVKTQGEAITQMGLERKAPTANLSFKDQVRAALIENKDKLTASAKASFEEEAEKATFSFKAVGSMSEASNIDVAATGFQYPQSQLVPGLALSPTRRLRLFDLAQGGSIGSNTVKWTYQAGEEGAAGQTSEASPKNQIDFNIEIGQEDVVKTTAYIRITDEMLEDIELMASHVSTELQKKVLLAVEAGMYSGAGTGNTLHGVQTIAAAWSAGSFATNINEANTVDVLRVGHNQILAADHEGATHILMHPTDVTDLMLTKATDGQYVPPVTNVGGTLFLDGMIIVPTTLVTADTAVIGDFSKFFYLERAPLSVEVGLNGDDWIENFRTVRAEWRGVSFVKHPDRTAFVYCSGIAAAKAALETP